MSIFEYLIASLYLRVLLVIKYPQFVIPFEHLRGVGRSVDARLNTSVLRREGCRCLTDAFRGPSGLHSIALSSKEDAEQVSPAAFIHRHPRTHCLM